MGVPMRRQTEFRSSAGEVRRHAGHGSTSPGRGPGAANTEVHQMRISRLLVADSPRRAGEDAQHIRVLAESEASLPPILVHRESMRVIDGVHRLHAALLKGEEVIDVRYFDGSEEDAFVLAVEANVTHGLPLSLADRKAAAVRILASHSQWSDRSIAAVTGLSSKTVGAIRRRTVLGNGDFTARIGRDGRTRPLDSAAGRRRAGELIARRPDASLRDIAEAAGISKATARDVRDRMRSGNDPVPPLRATRRQADSTRSEDYERARPVAGGPAALDRETALRSLSKDPALRFSESGRALLRWLATSATGPQGWNELMPVIPPHCSYILAALARDCAREWLEFAKQLEQRVKTGA
jgi:ParB-like chromosome segregation protein Spo0J